MKQTIQIEVPDGKVAVWEDDTLKFIDEPSMPKTWSEFCEVHPLQRNETFITCRSDIHGCGLDLRRREDIYYLPTREAAKAHLALMQLHQLRDYYRQGWTPNWLDNNFKWGIFICRNDIRIELIVYCVSFLSFQTKELAEEFLKNFRDLIKQAGDLI